MTHPLIPEVVLLAVEASIRETSLSSPSLPGGSLVTAVLDRRLMQLSDRGGASSLIGERWANLCAEALAGWPPRSLPIPDGDHSDYTLDRFIRLDDVPAISAAASRKQLQNPDFLLFGHRNREQLIQAADAKFSVETAKSRQVSAEVTRALFQLGAVLDDHLADAATTDVEYRDGVFLCPDFSLTHYMLQRKRGIRKLSVTPDEVILIPVTAASFLSGLELRSLMPTFARLDNLTVDYQDSLLATIFYFRLACAGVGCWLDETGPLLAFRDTPAFDIDAVTNRTADFSKHAHSGWDVVDRWDASAERVRQQRVAVEQVTALPVPGRQLREQIASVAETAGVVPPSTNKVRRQLGAWLRKQLREDFGPLHPPVVQFETVLEQLAARVQELQPTLDAVTEETIVNAVVEQPEIDEEPPLTTD